MKKVALTALVLALGLAGCHSKTANAVENSDIANGVEADTNAAGNSVDNALDAAGNAADNTGAAISNVGTATDNAVANEVNEKK